MTFENASVPVDRIDGIDGTDTAFQITTPSPIEPLMRSVDRVGVLSPPLLFPKEDHQTYGIVCGFRRIEACRQLGRSHVDARIAVDAEPALLAETAVSDNALQRPLNPIEVSRALGLLSSFYKSRKSLCAAGIALGLDVGLGLIDKLLPLCRLPDAIQAGILQEIIPLPVALELKDLPGDTGERFAALFTDLRPSLNKQREILTLMREIAAIEEKPLSDLPDDPEIRAILNDPEADRNRRLNALRTHLRGRRYPTITRAQQQYEENRARLDLDPGILLTPPKDFEGETYTLTLRFDSQADLRAKIETISPLPDHPALGAILRRNS